MKTKRRVLVVDHSRVVRSTLAKHLRDDFEVLEEADGESAWQTLVLNSSIIAVVGGVHLARLNGHELLARLRANKLRRLCDIPFLLVVSGNESAQEQAAARDRGVTDFITRGMTRHDIVGRIRRLVDWEFGQDIDDSTPPVPQRGRNTGNAAPASPEAVLVEALAGLDPHRGALSVIEFGLDDGERLHRKFGAETVQAITDRLVRVLAEKIGGGDRIAASGPTRCTIVSPGTSLASSVAFAQRVCRGLDNSQIAVRGVPFTPVVSAGIASRPGDPASDAARLLALARQRLRDAQDAGGNRVRAGGAGVDADYFAHLARLCVPDMPSPGTLGLQLMPLFMALEREFSFGLPLAEIERRFQLRAIEESSGQ